MHTIACKNDRPRIRARPHEHDSGLMARHATRPRSSAPPQLCTARILSRLPPCHTQGARPATRPCDSPWALHLSRPCPRPAAHRVHVPEVDYRTTSHRVLTMEFIDGVGVTDVVALRRLGVSPAAVSRLVGVRGGLES